MLEGIALFAGVKEFKAKSGTQCRICKLVDGDTGEMAEVFMADSCPAPTGLSIMAPVQVRINWQSFNGRTGFNLVEIRARGK